MTFPVRPELPTASVGSSQAPPAAVDNSAPPVIRQESTYKSGKVVQTNGATSKITFASTERIEEFSLLATDFMGQVFDFLPGEYLISDESDLLDFTEMGSSDTSEIWKRITEVYGVSLADVESERLVNVFTEITRRRNLQ